jgi:hypothetical protein
LCIHITPQLPPAVCGVGDYARVVGGRMEQLAPGVRCAYVAAGTRAAALPPAKGNESARLARSLGGAPSAAALWAAIESLADGRSADELAVVLHYSGYGYELGGAPAWLAAAVEQRPPRWSGVRWATMFHELFATGRPWERAFWSSGRQRSIAARIARASDALMTNREQSARWLETQAGLPAGSVPHLPVPSNVGEPAEIVPWDERPRRAVTFGGARFKRFALVEQADEAAELLRRLQIEELVDIGETAPIAATAFERRGIRVRGLGRTSALDVSAVLCQSRVGLMSYPKVVLTKSGILAAFAAHGMAVFGDLPLTGDGPTLLSLSEAAQAGDLEVVTSARTAAVANALWYSQHTSWHHGDLVVSRLFASMGARKSLLS